MKFSLAKIDRRVIYLFVLLALWIPVSRGFTVAPARMRSAEDLYDVVENLEPDENDIAFIALDFGPNTKAENIPQTEVVVEHLMRRHIPIAFFSLYHLASPFLESLPQRVADRLMLEMPEQRWEYGHAWVNIGYKPGGYLMIQAIPKSENLVEQFERDAFGTNLTELAAFKNVRTLEDIIFLGEFTGLVGVFDTYVQFFQKKNYVPAFGHGCTSITIPEAFIYLDSGQLNGLLEGIAGATWYSELLLRNYPNRAPDSSKVINTGLGVAHLIVILFVVIGNIALLLSRWRTADA